MKKTPLQLLIEWLKEQQELDDILYWDCYQEAINKSTELLPLEKQGIVDAYNQGYDDGFYDRGNTGEDYFNSIYEPQN